MNEPNPDPEITESLNQLAAPPSHGPGFWNELNTTFSNQHGNGAGGAARGTIRYLAVAAAALVVFAGGALILSSRDGNQNIVAIDVTTTTMAPAATSTSPTTAVAETTTTGLPPATEPRPTPVGTPIDDSWVVLHSSGIAEGDYVSRAQANIDCGMKDLAFARNGIITHDYGSRPGAFSYHPGPQGALTRLSTCSGTFLEMSIGSELGAPVTGFDPLPLTPEPIVLEDLGWDLVNKVMVGTAIFTVDPVSVRINSGTGEVTVVDSSTRFPVRATSELFHYDVGVPDQFNVDYATGRGVSLSDAEKSFDASIQLSNFLPGTLNSTNFTDPYADENLESTQSLTISLYENNGGTTETSGGALEITEARFRGGFSENRIVRVYPFDDRTVVAELRYKNGTLDDDPQDILNDIRMFDAAFEPLETCSSFGGDAPPVPAGLSTDQRATFTAITVALSSCDWDALDELTPPTFMASFGGGDPIELWQASEAFAEPVLFTLFEHLSVKPGFDEAGFASWPRAAGKFWEDVTPEMKAELLDLGYTQDDFELYAEIGYIGYRTGIDSDGTWIYYLGGD